MWNHCWRIWFKILISYSGTLRFQRLPRNYSCKKSQKQKNLKVNQVEKLRRLRSHERLSWTNKEKITKEKRRKIKQGIWRIHWGYHGWLRLKEKRHDLQRQGCIETFVKGITWRVKRLTWFGRFDGWYEPWIRRRSSSQWLSWRKWPNWRLDCKDVKSYHREALRDEMRKLKLINKEKVVFL